MSIGNLADAAGLSRRAVRFYVQRGLLPTPLGLGRGQHYDATHLERLNRIRQLQAAGHSLDAIARILTPSPGIPGEGKGSATPPPADRPIRRPRPVMTAELWTRLRLADGIELNIDATRYSPDAGQLQALRHAIRQILGAEPGTGGDGNKANAE